MSAGFMHLDINRAGGFGPLRPILKLGILAALFAICVTWFSTSQGDAIYRDKHPNACPVNHQPFGYSLKYRYTPDAKAYLMMAMHDVKNMIPPYRYRVLTPAVTRQLMKVIPRGPDALEMLTLVSLWLFYTLTAWTLLMLGAGVKPILFGFIGTLTLWHVYFYQNPWGVDGLYLLFAAGMIYAAVKRKYWLFLVCVVVGMFNKETILFLTPLWLVVNGRWWKRLTPMAMGLAVYLIPRMGESAEMGWYLKNYAGQTMYHNIHHWPVALLTVLWAWGLMWVIGYKGARKNRVIMAALLLLTAGAFLSCFFAADHGRMMASISPAMFPAISLFFAGGYRK